MSKRKDARAAAHKLRKDASWSSPVGNDPMEKLQQLDQEARGERVYADAENCPKCIQVRADSADETALCDDCLAKAMGF